MIELFTSQGCSSCPAADKLLGELAHDPSLVVMSLPVDYWDYLGWKDTLALPGHTNRQRAYSKARGDREVYTPQVVVNGVTHVLGSDKDAIDQAIAQTRKREGDARAPVSLSVAGEQISIVRCRPPRARREGRDLAVPDRQGRAGRDRQRGELRPHDHLSQRGAQLDQARRMDRRGAHLHGPVARRHGRSAPTRLRSWCSPAARKRRATCWARRSRRCSRRAQQSASTKKGAGWKPALRALGD